MSIIISFGKWGGFYLFNGFTKRICLGWIAITIIPQDIDETLHNLKDRIDELENQ